MVFQHDDIMVIDVGVEVVDGILKVGTLYSHRQPPFGTSKGTRSMFTSWATPLCLGKVQFLRLAAKEHKRRWAARRAAQRRRPATRAGGSRATGGTATAAGGTTTVMGGMTTDGTTDDGKGQQGNRRHDNGTG